MTRSIRMSKYQELMNPLLEALHELGGSGSIEEIAQEVVELPNLPEDILNILHNPEKSSQTEIEYRLAWARTYLKKFGILDNSDRGIWLIVPEKTVKNPNFGKTEQVVLIEGPRSFRLTTGFDAFPEFLNDAYKAFPK